MKSTAEVGRAVVGRLFLALLKDESQEQRTLELGFLPADHRSRSDPHRRGSRASTRGSLKPCSNSPPTPHPRGPARLFRENKKTAEVVLVFDAFGSMEGKPIVEAQIGAKAFLEIPPPCFKGDWVTGAQRGQPERFSFSGAAARCKRGPFLTVSARLMRPSLCGLRQRIRTRGSPSSAFGSSYPRPLRRPQGAVIRNLLTMWSRVARRH
jgi:hypothetical protein